VSERASQLKERLEKKVFISNRILFGLEGVSSEGYREPYDNFGIHIELNESGIWLSGLESDVPSKINICLPMNAEVVQAFVLHLVNLSEKIKRDRSEACTSLFYFDSAMASGEWFTLSQGRYGSRSKGVVETFGVKIDYQPGVYIEISPIITDHCAQCRVGVSNIRVPDAPSVLSKLGRLIDRTKSHEISHRATLTA